MAIMRAGEVYDSKGRMKAGDRAVRQARVRQPDIPRPRGPSRWEVIRNLVLRAESAPLLVQRMCREYPGIAFVAHDGESVYLASDPELIAAIFLTGSRHTTRPPSRRAHAVLGNGLLVSDGELHQRQRRLLQPAIHRTRVAGYAKTFTEEAAALSEGWRDGARVDMQDDMIGLTLRIVGRAIFGVDLSSDAVEVASAIREVLDNSSAAMRTLAGVRSRLNLPPYGRVAAASDRLDEVMLRIIEDHRRQGDTGDLLSMMIAAQEDGLVMDNAQLRDEAVTIVAAGHETVAMWLTWTWLLLARNPEQRLWLHGELDALPPNPVGFADVSGLPRTRAVLAESLRLYPPAWVGGVRLGRSFSYQGWQLPEGSVVLASQWVMHRHPAHWSHPEAFRPRRWLDSEGRFSENAPGQPKGSWFPFGFGRRRCIGDQFAWGEAVMVLAELARRWDPDLQDPATDVEPYGNITLRPRGGLPMVLRRRSRPDGKA